MAHKILGRFGFGKKPKPDYPLSQEFLDPETGDRYTLTNVGYGRVYRNGTFEEVRPRETFEGKRAPPGWKKFGVLRNKTDPSKPPREVPIKDLAKKYEIRKTTEG